MERIAILGAGGQLGTAFRELLGSGALAVTRDELDLTDLERIPEVLDELDASILINCAAYTDVDGAEDHEELATAVNGRAVETLSRWAAARGSRLLTFSTDYVFDGASNRPYIESSSTRPINAYGRSKLVGEAAALQWGALVIRTSWLFSGSHPNFIATVIRAARRGPIQVVQDQVGSPSLARDVAATSWRAMEIGATGLLHVVNDGSASRYELARRALDEAGIDPDLVKPCSSEGFPSTAARPAYSVMRSERFEDLGLDPLPPWFEGLGGVVEELSAWV